jgi:serine/threonine protein kinase/WD40 repeat protein
MTASHHGEDERPEIPDYTLIRTIGRGSFGVVWLAQNATGSWVAIKVIHRDKFDKSAEGLRYYKREFHGVMTFFALSQKNRRHLALLHVSPDSGRGFYYYVMELADDVHTGRDIVPETYEALTLDFYRGGEPAVERLQRAIRLVADAAEALDLLHAEGMVHQDVKPANFVVVNGITKLADVGSVRRLDGTYTKIGTPGYIAPEGPGQPSDIYALGKVLYELATGFDRLRFPDLPPEPMRSNRDFRELNKVWSVACAPNPKDRYASPGQMANDLRRILMGESAGAAKTLAQIRRAKLALAFLAPAMVLALGIIWVQSRVNRRFSSLYQGRALNNAALQLERGSFGRARRDLDEAAQHTNRVLLGPELAILRRQAAGDGSRLLAAVGRQVDQMMFSPDEQRLGILTANQELLVFRVSDGFMERRFPRTLEFGGLSADGYALVRRRSADGSNYSVVVLDRDSDTEKASRPGDDFPAGWSPDGSVAWLVAGAGSEAPEVSGWNWRTGAIASVPLEDFKGYTVEPPMQSIDGGRRVWFSLSSGSEDTYRSALVGMDMISDRRWFAATNVGTVLQGGWDKTTDRLLYSKVGSKEIRCITTTDASAPPTVFATLEAQPGAMAMSWDGSQIACSLENETVHIISARDGRLERRLQGSSNVVHRLAWGRSGLVTADRDGEIRLWNLDGAGSTNWVSGFESSGAFLPLVISPDERHVAIDGVSNTVEILDVSTLSRLHTVRGALHPLTFNGSDLLVALTNGRLGRVTIGTKRTAEATSGPHLLAEGRLPGRVHVAGDGRTGLVFSQTTDAHYRIACWDFAGDFAVPVARWEREYESSTTVFECAFAADARSFATLEGNRIVFWDTGTGLARKLMIPVEYRSDAYALCHLPGSDLWAVGKDDGTILLIDSAQMHVLPPALKSPLPTNRALISDATGRLLFAGGSGGRLAIFRTTSGSVDEWESIHSIGHRNLVPQFGEHTIARMVFLPGRGELLTITEDGHLVRW